MIDQNKLREKARKKFVNQNTQADKVGFTPTKYSRWLNGHDVREIEAEKIKRLI